MTSSPNKYDFSGRVALVTGSSSGIGKAIAKTLAQYGAKVAITGRSATNLAKVAAEIEQVSKGQKPLQIVGDLSDPALPARLVSETVAAFGRLDILVNNAGGATVDGRLTSPTILQEFDDNMRLNVRVPIELSALSVPHLEKTKGNIINISSIAAYAPYTVVYSSTKATIDMVTKTTALELGPKGIRCNSINPGPVQTAFTRSMGLDEKASAQVFENVAKQMLLKRVAEPTDIASLAAFLASDDAINITGSNYITDGGALLNHPNLHAD